MFGTRIFLNLNGRERLTFTEYSRNFLTNTFDDDKITSSVGNVRLKDIKISSFEF